MIASAQNAPTAVAEATKTQTLNLFKQVTAGQVTSVEAAAALVGGNTAVATTVFNAATALRNSGKVTGRNVGIFLNKFSAIPGNDGMAIADKIDAASKSSIDLANLQNPEVQKSLTDLLAVPAPRVTSAAPAALAGDTEYALTFPIDDPAVKAWQSKMRAEIDGGSPSVRQTVGQISALLMKAQNEFPKLCAADKKAACEGSMTHGIGVAAAKNVFADPKAITFADEVLNGFGQKENVDAYGNGYDITAGKLPADVSTLTKDQEEEMGGAVKCVLGHAA